MQEAEILEKFKKRGFNNLSVEDLAVIQQSLTWAQTFKQATNEDWGIYSDKAGERLSHSSFNVKWVSKSKSSYTNLFSSVVRGDVAKLLEFLRVSDLPSCRKALDSNNKTALHLAAREGKLEVVKILIEKGWEVDVKDKYSTTPLQQACNMNHFETVSYLIESGADPYSKDTLGRNSLMYAVCAPGVESAEALVSWGEFNSTKDSTGRTALHYAVFNPHTKQPEIFDLLLKTGINVNVQDNDGKTPLHHACEAGKAKAIRWLIKHGADENAKDSNLQTPYDVAPNENIKKMIGLCNVSEKTLKAFNEKKQDYREEVKFEPKAVYKEKLMNFLGQVQEAGIVSKQHLKKPQIYTGTWMEGVLSPITLFNELSYSSPSEAVLKVFNILFPYAKPVPLGREGELVLDEFFGGTSKSKPETLVNAPDEAQAKKVSVELEVYKKSIASLKESNETKDKNNARLDKELKLKLAEIEKLKAALSQVQESSNKAVNSNSNKEEAAAGEQLNEFKSKLARAEARFKEVSELNEKLQRDIDLRPKNSNVQVLIDKIQVLEADNRNLRFKAGQIFLRHLEAPEDPDVRPGQVYIQDLEKLKRLHLNLKTRPPSLNQRLKDVDFNQDGKISKAEASKVLTSLELPPQDIISLLRLMGFRQGNGVIEVKDALELLENVEEKERKLQSELFTRIIKILTSNSLGIEKAFEYLDVNKDGQVNFSEFSEGCESLHINLNREDKHALFSVLDTDHSGSINLRELKAKIDVFSAEHGISLAINPKSLKNPSMAGLVVINKGKNAKQSPAVERAKPRQQDDSLDGSLVVGIIKGKEFAKGNFTVQYSIDGLDKPQKTQSASGPNPEWKYKGRIRIADRNNLVLNDMVLDVLGDRGSVGVCKVNWAAALDFPNVWAAKDEYQVLDASGEGKGWVNVHLMWVPKEEIRNDTTGNLKIQIVSYSGFPASIIEFSLLSSVDHKPLKKDEEVVLKDLQISGDSPVPTLKCTVMKLDDRSVVVWRNLSIEVALGTSDWTRALKVPMPSGQELSVKFLWEELSAEYKQQVEAAVKIQTAYRGYQVRKDKIEPKNRKMIGKKVVRQEGVIYMVGIYQVDDSILLELHEVSDKNDFIQIIDSKTVKSSNVSEVSPQITVQNRKIVIDPNASQGVKDNIKRRQSKLIARRVLKRNQRYYIVTLIEQSGKIKASLGFADDDSSPMYKEISTAIIEKIETSEIFDRILIDKNHKISLSETRLEKDNLPREPKCKILKRKVVKIEKRFVMVSVFDSNEQLRVVGNLADEPGRSMFETQSEILIDKIEIDEVFTRVQLDADLKIKI